MPAPVHTLLIALLAFWTPVWCCGTFAANASAAGPVDAMSAHVEPMPHSTACEMTADKPQDADCESSQGDKSTCDCELMDGATLITSKVHETNTLGSLALTMPAPVAILSWDPAPATAVYPSSDPRGGSPPVAARALLAQICILTI